MDVDHAALGRQLQDAIRAANKTQREIVGQLNRKGWGLQETNFSAALNGNRKLSFELAKAVAKLINWKIPPDVEIWYGRQHLPEVPLVPLGELPMTVKGTELREALKDWKVRRPDWAGGMKDMIFVELEEPAFGYEQGRALMVAPHGTPAPKQHVIARSGGKQFVGVYQASGAGDVVADTHGNAYRTFEIVGVVAGDFFVY